MATRRWWTSVAPTTLPAPGRNCNTSSGTPASQRISHINLAITRVCVDGLTIAVLPVANAAVVMPAQIASGKFQGLITATTPRGSYQRWFNSPTNCPSRCGRKSPTALRA